MMHALLRGLTKPLLIVSLALPSLAGAWSAPAHQIIAQIAYDKLKPDAKIQVDKLTALMSANYPQQSDFVQSAIWADELKQHDIDVYTNWHFINQAFSPDGSKLPKVSKPNVVWAIKQCQQILNSRRANAFEKAFFLRFLEHLVADIHQPLHCSNRVTQQFPQGDLGGNLYPIDDARGPNLHQLWDQGLGLYDSYYVSKPDEQRQLIKQWAKKLEQQYPMDSAALNKNYPSQWAGESFKLARDFVYTTPVGKPPSTRYVQQGRMIAEQRIALAGYRLAKTINEIWAKEENKKAARF